MNVLATQVTIHWEVLPVIIIVIISISLFFSIISTGLWAYKKRKIKECILNSKFEEALQLALTPQKLSPSSFSKEENYLVIALLYFNKGDEYNWRFYLSRISRSKLQMEKNYWCTIAALIANDDQAVEQFYAAFKNSAKPNKYLPMNYEYYENNLKIIRDYHEAPNKETAKELGCLIKKCNPLHAAIINKIMHSTSSQAVGE